MGEALGALGRSCWVWGLALSTQTLQVSLGEMGGQGWQLWGVLCQQGMGRAQHHSPPGFDHTPDCHKAPGQDGLGGDRSVLSAVPGMLLAPRAGPAHPSCRREQPFHLRGGTNGAVRCHQPCDMTGCGAGAPRTEQPCLSEPPDTPHNGQMDETLKVGPGAFSTLFWVKTLLERS